MMIFFETYGLQNDMDSNRRRWGKYSVNMCVLVWSMKQVSNENSPEFMQVAPHRMQFLIKVWINFQTNVRRQKEDGLKGPHHHLRSQL